MKIVEYNPHELVEAEYNPRELTESQFKSLKSSLEKFGLVDPLIVNVNEDRKNILVGGHQRLKIAKSLAMDKVPCVEVDLSLERERELNIRLNKNVGQWDYDALANHFDVGELTDWGFTESELLWQGNYEPSFGSKRVDDDDIDEEQQKRDDYFKEQFDNYKSKLKIICPECAYEFQINEVS
tara:strand:+ start:415 stop:960 length:546 start_codon:yes stop_codon:yes gene_type:complete